MIEVSRSALGNKALTTLGVKRAANGSFVSVWVRLPVHASARAKPKRRHRKRSECVNAVIRREPPPSLSGLALLFVLDDEHAGH